MLIGIMGRKNSGKSTLGKQIMHYLNDGRCLKQPLVVPLATPIKDALEAMGVPRECLYGTDEQKNKPLKLLGGRSARYAMQTLGTEWGRDLMNRELWMNMWKERAKFNMEDGHDVLCDDIRRYDEVQLVKEMGGITIYIERPGIDASDAHASEKFIQDLPYDYKIMNDGTQEDLMEKVKEVLEDAIVKAAENSAG